MGSTAGGAYLEMTVTGELRRFVIPADSALLIGRSHTCSVVFEDEDVSRRHALLQRAEDNQYYIADLASRHGTYVNQKLVCAPAILQSGDSISIGSHTMIFVDRVAGPVLPPTREARTTSFSFEPKLVTVLVADIRGFCILSQRVESEVLSLVTGTLFRKAGKVLEDRGAWAQKYLGDAVMAIWVHENLEPTHAELHAIFESLSQILAITGSLQTELGLDEPICVGVGVNTGWASTGNVGSCASSDHTVLGEIVNQAFRLEAATRELGCDIALGQGTYDFLTSSTDVSEMLTACSVKLKGYEEPLTAYTASEVVLPTLLGSFYQRLFPNAVAAAASDFPA